MTAELMPDFPNHPNLDAALLRAEQNYFEQALEQSQQLTSFEEQRKDLEHTIEILRCQLAQAQEEIGTANGRLEHTLATQISPITIVQLRQAQEELTHALHQLNALERWQHLAQHSLKMQLKLLIKSLLRNLFNHFRWLIPLKGARRIKSLLLGLKQRLSTVRQ